jgi:hypothetical protein
LCQCCRKRLRLACEHRRHIQPTCNCASQHKCASARGYR